MQHRTSLVDRMLERLVPKATVMATSVCPLPSDCYYTGNRYGSACRGGYIYEVQCGPREGYSHWFQCPC
jgi:hypothetical protein